MSRQATPAFAPLFPYLPLAQDAVLAPGELIVDNFAGLGGASTGLEQALGRPVDIAINHSRAAVELHSINHPYTRHYTEDVWEVNPLQVTGGQRVRLAWFSPTCTHFSKAKGSGLLDRKIRGLAWVKLRWLDLTLPDIAITENVEEFRGWCDLGPDGRPKPGEKGRTFNVWVNAMRRLGYEVEWRELRACDYGAPTIRKRLFVVARRDGLPIVWPEPTHGKPTDPRVRRGELAPWRTAAECIDWDLPCPSIFTRRKPLVTATLKRITRGITRYVLEAQEPFIVTCNHGGEGFRGQSLDQPFNTVTAANEAHGLTVPHLTKFNTGSIGSGLSQPAPTVMAGGTPARESTGNPHGLVAAQLLAYYGQKREGEVRGLTPAEPLRTQGTENRFALMSASLIKHFGGTYQGSGASLNEPAHTLTAVDHHGLLTGALVACGGRGAQARPKALDEPMHTVTGKADMTLTTAHLTAYYSQNGRGDAGQSAAEPLRTVPTVDRFGPTLATLIRQFGTSTATDVAAPLGTVTTMGGGKSHLMNVLTSPVLTGEQLSTARKVYALLADYAPEVLERHADHARQLVLVTVQGELYVLADIGMRMLTPRELARCQGFPEDFKLDATLDGKPLSKAAQVRGIGNSVCPPLARAIAHAQLTARPAQQAAD